MFERLETPIISAIYLRVSTLDQAEHGFSIDAQREILLNYCAQTGRTVYKVYCDRGLSGKSTEKRYELLRMLEDAKKGLFNEVLVWKISRLARRTLDLLRIVDELDRHNVSFRSYSENFETASPMGKFALQMMGAVSELERNNILENASLCTKQRVRTGGHVAKAPLGYRIVVLSQSGRKRETRMEVVPEEAAIVRRIFEQFASGRGYRSIANELNRDGHKTKEGNPFSICAVKDILDNPFYVGKVRYARYVNWSEKRRKGKNANPIVAVGQHPPIIAEDLWNKVQYLRRQKGEASPKRFHGDFLLTGLLRCPQCGSAMTASRTNNRDKNGNPVVRLYYSCSAMRSKGSSVCSANSIRKQDAERYVFDRLKEVLSKPHILKGIVKGINERKAERVKPLQDELEAVRSRIAEVEAKKKKYLELYEEDGFDRKLLTERLNELESDLGHLHARKSELEFELDGDRSEPVSYETVRSLIARFEQLLRYSNADQRKTLLHLIVKRITLNDKRQIDKIELVFDEESERHFLSFAPSAAEAEGASLLRGEVPKLKQKLTVVV